MQNFMQIPPRGVSGQMGEIHAKSYIYICLFFFNASTGQTTYGIFTLNASNDAVLHKKVPFGVRKVKFNI